MPIFLILLILLTIAILVPLGAGAASYSGGRSRVDWSKVFIVLIGIPLMVLAVAGVSLVADKHQAETEMQRAITDREQARRAQESERMTDELARESQQPVESIKRATPPHRPHHSPAISNDSLVLNQRADSVGMAFSFIVFAILVFALTWIVRNHSGLALGGLASVLILFICGLGMIFSFRSETVTHMTQIPVRPTLSQVTQPETSMPEKPISLGTGPGLDEEVPLKIIDITIDPRGGLSAKNVEQYPDWVLEAKGEKIARTEKGQLILTSGRFTTVEEAEAQLQQQATAILVTDLLQNHPDINGGWLQTHIWQEVSLLKQKCEITWPFQIGEVTTEMQQVVWNLKLDQSLQNRLYADWQSSKQSERLTILGSLLAGITLLFGSGAILTRPREVRKSAAE